MWERVSAFVISGLKKGGGTWPERFNVRCEFTQSGTASTLSEETARTQSAPPFKTFKVSPTPRLGVLHSYFYGLPIFRVPTAVRASTRRLFAHGLQIPPLRSFHSAEQSWASAAARVYCSLFYLLFSLAGLKSSGVLAHGYLVSWHAFRTRRLHSEMVSELHFVLPGVSVPVSSLFMFSERGWTLQISCRSHTLGRVASTCHVQPLLLYRNPPNERKY